MNRRLQKFNLVLTALIIAFAVSSCNGQNNGRKRRVSTQNNIVQKDTIDPKVLTEKEENTHKPVVNVYVENSGSMDGFVKGVTDFEAAVYNYLSDIKISDLTDSLNLYYINSEVISYAKDADVDVIEDFIKKLEPSEFKKRGGDRGKSDIADVIRSILKETNENDISILITDGIFSPGRDLSGNPVNADEYLKNQEVGIKTAIASQLKKQPNFAVIVYQLVSRFDGTFYNKIDTRIPCQANLPFYIWIFGQSSDLAQLRSMVPEDRFEGSGVQRMVSFTSSQDVDYEVIKSSNMSKKSGQHEVVGLTANRNGDMRFSVNVNLKSFLLDEYYLDNINNYEISDKDYTLNVGAKQEQTKYSHVLSFTINKNKRKNGQLDVKLKMSKPDWSDVNDDEGETYVIGKTYGIKYQIDGVYSAFSFKNKYYTDIILDINNK